MKIERISLSVTALPRMVLIFAIRCYQKTAILRAPSCRFYPSCSEYTAGSVAKHGVVKGAALGLVRICKCHPWNDGGVDLVPENASFFGNENIFGNVDRKMHQSMQR